MHSQNSFNVGSMFSKNIVLNGMKNWKIIMHSPLRQPNSFTRVGETNLGKNKFIMRAHMRIGILQHCWIQFCYVWKVFRFFYDFFIFSFYSDSLVVPVLHLLRLLHSSTIENYNNHGCLVRMQNIWRTQLCQPKIYFWTNKNAGKLLHMYMNISAAPCLAASKWMDYHSATMLQVLIRILTHRSHISCRLKRQVNWQFYSPSAYCISCKWNTLFLDIFQWKHELFEYEIVS